MTILDRYFELSDSVSTNEGAFRELVSLFAKNAVLRPAKADEVVGKDAIAEFFDGFFKKNTVMKHVWHAQTTERGLKAVWAVAGQRKNGEIFAVRGIDAAELDEDGKIRSLEVQFRDDTENEAAGGTT